jgi:hypothetical protein
MAADDHRRSRLLGAALTLYEGAIYMIQSQPFQVENSTGGPQGDS